MRPLIVASLALLASSSAFAQSYDCKNSKTAAELVVCDSPDLSRLDRQLNRVYARSNTSVWKQRAWLRSRNACGIDARCIRRLYLRRIEELRGD
jgi:uncharacterized protein